MDVPETRCCWPGTEPSLLSVALSSVHPSGVIEFVRRRMRPGIVGRAAAVAGKSVNNKSNRRHVAGRSLRDNSDKKGGGMRERKNREGTAMHPCCWR